MIEREYRPGRHSGLPLGRPVVTARILALWCFLVVVLVSLGAVAFHMQVVRGPEFRRREKDLRSSLQVIPAARGRILDARERILAEDEVSYDIEVVPVRLPLSEVVYEDIAYLLKSGLDREGEEFARQMRDYAVRLSGEEFVRALSKELQSSTAGTASLVLEAMLTAARQGTGHARVMLERDVPFPRWIRIKVRSEMNLHRYEGIYCVVGRKRRFPYSPAGAHALGYVRRMDREDLRLLRATGALLGPAGPQENAFLNTLIAQLDESVRLRRRFQEVVGLPGEFEDVREFLCACASKRRELSAFLPEESTRALARLVEAALLKELSPAERLILDERPYLPDDRIGASGVEYRQNRLLAGSHGVRLLERTVDKSGGNAWTRYQIHEDPIPGGDLSITLDIILQQAMEKRLAAWNRPAAAVLMRTSDGSILALASHPGFDPEDLSSGKKAGRYLEAPDNPLLCRVHQGEYPLGSVFKILDGIAGLESGVITPQSVYTCPGSLFHAGHNYKCNNIHGAVSLPNALGQSCNVFFYHLALGTGAAPIIHTARSFGLGTRTGIDLPFERSGIFPREPEELPSRDLLFIAIGQGPLAVTPIQAVCIMAGIANRGRMPRPRLAVHRKVLLHDLRTGLSEKEWTALTNGLTATVHLPNGTAHGAFSLAAVSGRTSFLEAFPYIMVAGKTGTAEHGMKQAGRRLPHSWFAGFAPARSPEVAVTVIVEHGGSGGGSASRTAAGILYDYFRYSRQGAEPR